jgi:hypothetical protein
MLGKLLKYEFKATGHFLGLMYLVVLIVATISGALGRSGMEETIGNDTVCFIFMMIYVTLIIALIIITLILIIERFYKNLLQGEGYLMHTLPVPTWMHVASKTISAIVWEILGTAVLILSVLLFFTASGTWNYIQDLFNTESWREIWTFLAQYRLAAILFVICVFIQLTRIALMFYASMSIGASATRHKIFFSILSFVVIMIALNVISVVANLGMVADLTISGDELLTDQSMSNLAMCGILGKQILTDLIYSVVFFLITNYFLKKKLNLE